MEISLETIISIVGLLLGGGGIGGFFTYRYTKRKERAEASTSEAGAAKEWQDVYQQIVSDLKSDRDEQKTYIQELKDDRRHLREERDDLRKRQDDLDDRIWNLQREVQRTTKLVEQMRPFLCQRAAVCKLRVPVEPSEDVASEEPQPEGNATE